MFSIGYKSEEKTPDSALIAVRFPAGTADVLTQEAIIQLSPRTYYVLDLTTPGSKAGSGTDKVSDDERQAALIFTGMIDSIRMVDRSDVRRDQDERLFRSRFLMMSSLSPSRIRGAIKPEQWFRIIRDGKDVGYTFSNEEEAEKRKLPGVLIGARTRMVTPTGQTNSESFCFVSYDRSYEEWSTVSQADVAGPDGKPRREATSEIGMSAQVDHQVFDTEAPRLVSGGYDVSHPATIKKQNHHLTVVYNGQIVSPPVEIDLPPFYLPQAIGTMLPRLLPVEMKTYMFATYVGPQRTIVLEYVDVLPEADVLLAGKKVHAITVQQRIGIEGPPTLHYVTRQGVYLGSVNETLKTQILPTDKETLLKLWDKADLSKPVPPEPKSLMELLAPHQGDRLPNR